MDWNEADHPRDEIGRFSDGSGGARVSKQDRARDRKESKIKATQARQRAQADKDFIAAGKATTAKQNARMERMTKKFDSAANDVSRLGTLAKLAAVAFLLPSG